MNIAWTRHLSDEEEKAKFMQEVRNAKRVLDRLKDITNEHVKEIERSERTIKDFDQPNWSKKQAYRNGMKAFADLYLGLFNLDKRIITV